MKLILKTTKLMKAVFKIAIVAITIAMASCNSNKSRNYQYFPNMYQSVGYEAYSSHDNEIFADNGTSEALQPVAGTVKRGWLPYDYDNNNEGYLAAKSGLKNPLPYTKENSAKGMQLYTIYCAICHGDKGDGKGTLVQREKILGVPSYDDAGRAITEGSIYHVMYYGINSMGSYASQTSIEERWLIAQYVQELKAKLEGKTPKIDANIKVGADNELYLFGTKSTNGINVQYVNEVTLNAGSESHDYEVEYDEEGHVIQHTLDKADSTIKKSKEGSGKPLIGGKSHHSHKEAGLK